jgi:ribosomal protein S14
MGADHSAQGSPLSRPESSESDLSSPEVRMRILEALSRCGLRPSDVNRRFSLSRGYFGKVLAAQRVLTKRHIAELALLTGFTETWFITGKGRERTAESEPTYSLRGAPFRYCPHCGKPLPLLRDPPETGKTGGEPPDD